MDAKECHQFHWLSERRFAHFSIAAATLLAIGISGCSKPPDEKEIKAARAAQVAQTTGRLVIKSNRANTTIEASRVPTDGDASSDTVKGTDGGATEQVLATLPPGKYVITARSAGWPDIREEANVDAGSTTEVAINFKSGSLRLDSLPVGATVKQGNAVLGKTPLVVAQLPLGECQLTLEYPLWPVLPFKTTITENVETAETVRMPHGKLVVESSPPGASILLGGRSIGKTPLTIERFQAGTKKLTLQAKDFPPMEITVTMEDHGEVKVRPVLANAFPEVAPESLLRAVWVDTPPENKDRLAPALKPFTSYPSRNGIIKNLDRKKLFEIWLGKQYRFSGSVKSYNRDTGQIEFAEEKNDLSRCRVLVQLSVEARGDKDLAAQLTTKAATVALYGRLVAVEEPEWPAKFITIEFSAAEPLPGGLLAAP